MNVDVFVEGSEDENGGERKKKKVEDGSGVFILYYS